MANDGVASIDLDSALVVETFVREQADDVHDPCSMALGLNVGLSEMGLIRNVEVVQLGPDWSVKVHVRLTSPGCQYFFYFQEQLEARLLAHPRITGVEVTWDHVLDWTPEDMAHSARNRIAQRMSMLRTERPSAGARRTSEGYAHENSPA